MKKKLGPLPVWAWGVIFGVAGYFLYERYKSQSANAAASPNGPGVLDPNSVDPNTGLTYGQEESAALNGGAGFSGGGGGGIGTPADSGAQGTVTPPNEFQDFLTFLQEWNQFSQTLGWQPPGTPSSPTSSAAASSPPVQTTNPPTSPASSHTNPYIGWNQHWLAPGVQSPWYALVLPKGAPVTARWSGPQRPGSNWTGIGGGWWVPKQAGTKVKGP